MEGSSIPKFIAVLDNTHGYTAGLFNRSLYTLLHYLLLHEYVRDITACMRDISSMGNTIESGIMASVINYDL